jgi:hypothetical protein
MLLCDHAEEINGKLYIMGGGWSKVLTPNTPFNMALAIKISVPWMEANRLHNLTIRLLTEQFEQVKMGGEGQDEGQDIQLAGKVEVGRPPGMRPGSYLDAPIAASFQQLVLSPGIYLWELAVNDRVLKRVPFDVVQPQ